MREKFSKVISQHYPCDSPRRAFTATLVPQEGSQSNVCTIGMKPLQLYHPRREATSTRVPWRKTTTTLVPQEGSHCNNSPLGGKLATRVHGVHSIRSTRRRVLQYVLCKSPCNAYTVLGRAKSATGDGQHHLFP